jgi:hypothetical protein
MNNPLFLADLKGMTPYEVKKHIAGEYAGDKSGFDYGRPSDDVATLAKKLDDFTILIAYESVGNWGCDSSSWFLMRKNSDNTLWEFSGGHCSCYGFEGQFDPEETQLEYLKSDKFYFSTGGYDDDRNENESKVKAYLEKLA